MSNKPILVATHPRACSTAFERVFLTCDDTLKCFHEPFGFPYYFGAERLNDRFEGDEQARIDSGCSGETYKAVFDRIEQENAEGKRIFIKDMAQYWIPTHNKPASIAPSLLEYKRRVGALKVDTVYGNQNGTNCGVDYPYSTPPEPDNPTIIPEELLSRFHFTFLIRHPHSSIPSYYRCTLSPLREMTGWTYFDPSEAGYSELRRLFEYVLQKGFVGPHMARTPSLASTDTSEADESSDNDSHSGENEGVDICVIDADDLLDNPYGIIEAYCKSVGIPFSERMLKWSDEDQSRAKVQFDSWKGFHEDAIQSSELKPRMHKKVLKSDHELYQGWAEKYGEEAAKVIEKTVKENVEHYEYLKQFAIKV